MALLSTRTEPARTLSGRSPLARVSALLFALAVSIITAPAEELSQSAALEYQVKAAFLYNFAKFVEWPAEKWGDDGSPILVGVLGKDPFGPTLDQTFRGKTVNGREVVVRRITGLPEAKRCHILFIGSAEKGQLGEIFHSIGNNGVLTVGEMRQFAQQGGMINFTTEENKVRLEINVDAAERSGVKISSKLLKLARVVRDQAGDRGN